MKDLQDLKSDTEEEDVTSSHFDSSVNNSDGGNEEGGPFDECENSMVGSLKIWKYYHPTLLQDPACTA